MEIYCEQEMPFLGEGLVDRNGKTWYVTNIEHISRSDGYYARYGISDGNMNYTIDESFINLIFSTAVKKTINIDCDNEKFKSPDFIRYNGDRYGRL